MVNKRKKKFPIKISFLCVFLLLSIITSYVSAETSQETWICFAYWENGSWQVTSQVAEMNDTAPTGYNQQRGVLIDQQGYFWVFGYEWTTKWYENYTKTIEGFSSLDGLHWSDRQRVASISSTGEFSWEHREELHQSVDWVFQSDVGKGIGMWYRDSTPYWVKLDFADGVLTREALRSWGESVNFNGIGHRYANTSDYWVVVVNNWHPELGNVRAFTNEYMKHDWSFGKRKHNGGLVPYANDAGETVTLSWNETTALYVTVKGDYSVNYGWVNATGEGFPHDTKTYPPISMGFSTRSGIDALVGCSEPELLGWETGELHILYIKDSPEDLCHRSFDGKNWSSEEVVATGSGITSPTLACDSKGDLLACYIRDGEIRYKSSDAGRGGGWGDEMSITGSWTNPSWLTSSQMEYDGKILLAWTDSPTELKISSYFVESAKIIISLFTVAYVISLYFIIAIVKTEKPLKKVDHIFKLTIGTVILLFVVLVFVQIFTGWGF